MPNWCANRLRVSGPEYHVQNARPLIEGGEGVPLYARAAAEGIQLFLAGCAGLLCPMTGETIGSGLSGFSTLNSWKSPGQA